MDKSLIKISSHLQFEKKKVIQGRRLRAVGYDNQAGRDHPSLAEASESVGLPASDHPGPNGAKPSPTHYAIVLLAIFHVCISNVD
jgi:hypothetical protein